MQQRGLTFSDARRIEVERPLTAGGKPSEEARSKEQQAIAWLECVLGCDLQGVTLHEALLTGERLCDLINQIKPGVVSRVSCCDALDSSAVWRSKRSHHVIITRQRLGTLEQDCFKHMYVPSESDTNLENL